MEQVNMVSRMSPEKAKRVLGEVTDAFIMGESLQDVWNALVHGGAMDIVSNNRMPSWAIKED